MTRPVRQRTERKARAVGRVWVCLLVCSVQSWGFGVDTAVCRDEARGKSLGQLALCPKVPTSLIGVSLTGRPAERYKGPFQMS